MHQLTYELTQMAHRNRDGSHNTQADRHKQLKQIAEHLHDAGYKKVHAHELKGRHIHALLQRWEQDGIADRTRANRLAVLRWVAEKIGNPGLLKPSNAAYGVAKRQSVPTVSKAKDVPERQFASVKSPWVRHALLLQQAFGMRREEAIKVRVWSADKGTHLEIRPSSAKGGHGRDIPITTLKQRGALDQVKDFVPSRGSSLIPPDRSYAQQLKSYEHATKAAGIRGHSLRHAWAQQRFAELAGFPAPLAGGPHAQELTPEQRDTDRAAREVLSEELGHHRTQITASYIGR